MLHINKFFVSVIFVVSFFAIIIMHNSKSYKVQNDLSNCVIRFHVKANSDTIPYLLGLDVVLLYYPAHIAAAVCFKGEVKGDYMQLGNKRYVICDATYIGAGVGEAMPDLKRTPAQVVRID